MHSSLQQLPALVLCWTDDLCQVCVCVCGDDPALFCLVAHVVHSHCHDYLLLLYTSSLLHVPHFCYCTFFYTAPVAQHST